MNKKRWIALIIAGVLALVWLLLLIPKNQDEAKLEKNQTANGLYETTLEQGSGKQKIAVLKIDGGIMAGGTKNLFAEEGYNHEFFLQQLAAIQEDPLVTGILLEVNSPGGGVYESAEITRALTAIQAERKVPFYVSMKNMAASGGYYVAASADKIFATEETMTGSIGVIMSGLNMAGLLDKLGIADETVKSGELKDIGSTTRKWTEKDRKVMQEMIDSSYNRFVNVVATGRKIPEDRVRVIADGRIYDGIQALQNGLVDEIGFPDDALAALIKDNNLSQASVISYSSAPSLFGNPYLDRLLGSQAKQMLSKKVAEPELITELLKSLGTADAPRMMYLYGGE